MRYAQRGGYTPADQERRERLRLEAAGRFARGGKTGEVARDLRVTAGRCGGGGGPGVRVALGRCGRGAGVAGAAEPAQWARLEADLRKGPLVHGFAADQRWTL